eukprot:1460860-Rhodomonas_salina.1
MCCTEPSTKVEYTGTRCCCRARWAARTSASPSPPPVRCCCLWMQCCCFGGSAAVYGGSAAVYGGGAALDAAAVLPFLEAVPRLTGFPLQSFSCATPRSAPPSSSAWYLPTRPLCCVWHGATKRPARATEALLQPVSGGRKGELHPVCSYGYLCTVSTTASLYCAPTRVFVLRQLSAAKSKRIPRVPGTKAPAGARAPRAAHALHARAQRPPGLGPALPFMAVVLLFMEAVLLFME